MAQHDYVIDNANGATVRSDVNNALAAVVSNNSGTTAPATTYAYQFWVDTTANKIKIRNSANSAWLDFANFSSSLAALLPAIGSASLPSYSFTGDENTGMYSAAANKLNFATDGASRMEIGTTGIISHSMAAASYATNIAVWNTGMADTNFITRILTGINSTAAGSIQSSIDLAYSAVGTVAGIRFGRGASSGAGTVELQTGDVTRCKIDSSGVYPGADNTYSCGLVGSRWSVVYANNGTIQTSDKRRKDHVEILTEVGAIVDALQPARYRWKKTGALDLGFYAQDVVDLVPEAVEVGDEEIDWGFKPDRLIPILLAEIQSLRRRVAAMEARDT